ncbi:MAG: hypothetical protein ACRBCS_00780 [Cellvibrionaceae bacterium]
MSKKPISIKQKPSKKALLDELESIKHLLDDEDSDFEPPLLTQEVSSSHQNFNEATDSDIDFDALPVLTDSLDVNEEDIPTLESSVEEDDIVSRAMKAQSFKDSPEQFTPSQQKTKSLFDDEPEIKSDPTGEELSPEMIALNAMPKDVVKPKAPNIEEPTKPSESETTTESFSETKPLKPESKKFLSLEEELKSIANDIVDETPIDTTLDENHVNETLKEFDDYLIENDPTEDSNTSKEIHREDETPFDDKPSTGDALSISNAPQSDNEAIEQSPLALKEDVLEETEEEAPEFETLDNADALQSGDNKQAEEDSTTEFNIEDDSFENSTAADTQEDTSDESDDSLLEAAILEVTNSITGGDLSEQVQESLAKDKKTNESESTKEHQPSLFDTSENDSSKEALNKKKIDEADQPKSDKEVSTIESTAEKPTKESDGSLTSSVASVKTPNRKMENPAIKKTENPFLPKHIRERLHTNRTLQQEIDDSTAAQMSLDANEKLAKGNQPPSTENPPASKPTENTPTQSASQEDRVIEEVIGSVLPKIESELRQKIRELIKQEKSSD